MRGRPRRHEGGGLPSRLEVGAAAGTRKGALVMLRADHTALILARLHHERLFAEAERERQAQEVLEEKSSKPAHPLPLLDRVRRWRRRPAL